MAHSTPFEAAAEAAKVALSNAERVIAQLGDLPNDLEVTFDQDEWSEKLAIPDTRASIPAPSTGWFVRG